MAAAMRLGVEVAAVAATLHQSGEKGQADAEAAGDGPPGTFLVFDSGGDALAEV
jgi:hypothetical protein